MMAPYSMQRNEDDELVHGHAWANVNNNNPNSNNNNNKHGRHSSNVTSSSSSATRSTGSGSGSHHHDLSSRRPPPPPPPSSLFSRHSSSGSCGSSSHHHNASNNSNISSSTAWRKPGEELRAQLLRQDHTHESQLTLKPDCPMSRYIQVSERVLEQFLQHSVETYDQLMHAYLVGARLETFLKDVLPQHPEYTTSSSSSSYHQLLNQHLSTLKQYLEKISLLIDQQAYQEYIHSVLVNTTTTTSSADADNAAAVAVAFATDYADPSLDLGALDESSMDVSTSLRNSTATTTTTKTDNRLFLTSKQRVSAVRRQQSHHPPPPNKNSSSSSRSSTPYSTEPTTATATCPPVEGKKEVWQTALPMQKAFSTTMTTLALPSATVSPGTSYETAAGSNPSDEEKKEENEGTPRVTNKTPWVQEWCKNNSGSSNNSNNNKSWTGTTTTATTTTKPQPWNLKADERSRNYVSPDELVRRNKNSMAGFVNEWKSVSPEDEGKNYVSPEEKMRHDLFYDEEEPAPPHDEQVPATTRKPKRLELSNSPPIWEDIEEEKEESLSSYRPIGTSLSQKLEEHQRRAPTWHDEDSASDLFSGLTSSVSGSISVTSSMFQDAASSTKRRSKSPPKSRKSATKMQVVPEEEQHSDDSFRMNTFTAFSSTVSTNSVQTNRHDPFSSGISSKQQNGIGLDEFGRKDPPGQTPSARRRERQQNKYASLHPLAPPSNDSRHTTKETSRRMADPLDDLVKRKAAEKDDFFALVAEEKAARDAWDSQRKMPWDDGKNGMDGASPGQVLAPMHSPRRFVAEDEESMVMETRRLSLQPFRNCVRALLE